MVLVIIVILPQRNFLQLGIVANSLQRLKEIVKEPLAVADAASVGIYHENWVPVTSEDHFKALLFPNSTFIAVTGNVWYPVVPPLHQQPPHQQYDCHHGDSIRPIVITDIWGNASHAPNNPAPSPEIPPQQELRCQSRNFASPLSDHQSLLNVQSLSQQPPLYHVASQRYFPSRVAPPEAFPNQTIHHTSISTPIDDGGGMPVNYQVGTVHVREAACVPPNKATLTASLSTITYSVAPYLHPGMINLAATTPQHTAKDWNGGCTEQCLLSIDPDPPAPPITIPDQCSISGACSVSEVMDHTASHTPSSNDQNMDDTLNHCKKEATVVPTTACEPLATVPLSDQKVHMHTEDGGLAKKLPFEDFCTEMESLMKESTAVEERDNYFTCLCGDQIPPQNTSTLTSTFPSLCKDSVSSVTASTFTLCKDQFQAETISTIHQTCPLIVKLPLKYYIQRSSQMKRVKTRRKRIMGRKIYKRRKRTKPLCVRIPLVKLNNMPQHAGVKHASAPVFRKTIQVTSSTKIIPLKQLDNSKTAAKGINCLSADTSSQIVQCGTSCCWRRYGVNAVDLSTCNSSFILFFLASNGMK